MSSDTDVLIIGAGMSGIGTAVQLIRHFGTRNFEIIEKSDDVGGTWSLNTYPGCGCDVPSHFYSFSFALNPDWSQVYPMQPELHAYFRSVAESARWDEASATWSVEIEDIKTKATQYRRWASTFNGRLFHSAQWDKGFDWKGKDVVVIGFRGFSIKSGENIRAQWAEDASTYIRQTAPARYREALVPKSVIGCKRRVNDTGYLQSLHQPNVELVYDDPIAKISEHGVHTASGRFVHADAIVLATGFQTHRFLFPMQIVGESCTTLQEHWDKVSAECAESVMVKPEAEIRDNDWIQQRSKDGQEYSDVSSVDVHVLDPQHLDPVERLRLSHSTNVKANSEGGSCA
ncbi:hypothetical protein N0V95_000525 [Ascochyta clinopodiicola]|nr:hypothetical protein N0V95_000525 [Ascochyta clinopodiicola]